MAPNVTSSPWAKLVSPVVPKISDSPSAASASSSENVMPPTASCSTWVTLPAPAALSSPIGKVTKMSASVVILVVSDVFFSSTSEVPSGRVSVSILIVKLLPRLSDRRPGKGHVEDALRVAGALADDLAGLVLDGDRHIGHGRRRLVAVVGEAADHVDGVAVARRRLLAGLGGGRRGGRGARRGWLTTTSATAARTIAATSAASLGWAGLHGTPDASAVGDPDAAL